MISIEEGKVDCRTHCCRCRGRGGGGWGGEFVWEEVTLFMEVGYVPLNSPLEIEAVVVEGSRDRRVFDGC